MKKMLLALALVAALVSCKETDPDYASGIEGKYKVTAITNNGVARTTVDPALDYIELTRTTDNTVKYYQHLTTGDTTYNDVVIDSYSNAFHLNKITDNGVSIDTLTGDESYKNLTIKIDNGTDIIRITAGR